MPEFQSPLTPLIAKANIPWKDATENLSAELETFFGEKGIAQKHFASAEEYRRLQLLELASPEDAEDELSDLEALGPEAYAEMENDPRIEMFRENADLLEGISHATTLQELDNALTTYDEFLREHIRWTPAELKQRIGTYLFERAKEFQEQVNALMERDRELVKDADSADPGDERLTEQERREVVEHLLRTGKVEEVEPLRKRSGERPTSKGKPQEIKDNVIEFDPLRRVRR